MLRVVSDIIFLGYILIILAKFGGVFLKNLVFTARDREFFENFDEKIDEIANFR